MNAFTAANGFATILQLIGIFRQERGAAATLDHQQFLEWLDNHRHDEIKKLISKTYHLQTEVDAILKADHHQMLEKLNEIGNTVAALASHVAEFRPLVMKLQPSAELSDQAISIVRQLVTSGQERIFLMLHSGGSQFSFEAGGDVEVKEPHFLADDLKLLKDLNLLSLRNGDDGVEWYSVTRQAVRFINSVDGKKEP